MASTTVYWKDGSSNSVPSGDVSYWQSQGWSTTPPATSTPTTTATVAPTTTTAPATTTTPATTASTYAQQVQLAQNALAAQATAVTPTQQTLSSLTTGTTTIPTAPSGSSIIYWKDGTYMTVPQIDTSYWLSQGWSATKPGTTTTATPTTPTTPTGQQATLYGPNNEAKVVTVGSQEASTLQSQGWGLTSGSYKAPVSATPTPTEQLKTIQQTTTIAGSDTLFNSVKDAADKLGNTAKANYNYINAAFRAIHGRDATQAELDRFNQKGVLDVYEAIVAGKPGLDPYAGMTDLEKVAAIANQQGNGNQANENYINAAFRALHGRDANATELKNLVGKGVLDVYEAILAGRNSTIAAETGVDKVLKGTTFQEKYMELVGKADAYAQTIASQLNNMQTDIDNQQATYQAQLNKAEADMAAMKAVDGKALWDEYQKTEGLIQKKASLSNINDKLTQLNAQMQTEMQIISQKPILGAIIQGQKLFKAQQYLPQITMYQAQAEILRGDIDSATAMFQNYYTWAKDAYDTQLANYSRLYDLANNKLIKLDSDEKTVINAKVAQIEALQKLQQDNKDKLLGLMATYPTAFTQAKISPTDTYESALKKMVPFMKEQKTYSSGIVGEYQYYADQQIAAGKVPMDFNSYQDLDANRKKAIARAGTTVEDKQTLANQAAFNKYIDDIIKNLDGGTMSWANGFNAVKIRYPELTNEEINSLLGGAVYYDPATGEFSNPTGRAKSAIAPSNQTSK